MSRAVALLLGLCCGGCGLLGGKSAPTYEYYVLTPTEQGTQGDEAQAEGDEEEPRATLLIGQLNLPRYLEREAIVTRLGERQIEYSDRARWGERLDASLEQTLQVALARRLEPEGIEVAVPPSPAGPDCRLEVELQRFERHGADRVELWATWALRRGREIVHSDETRLSEQLGSPDTDAAVEAMGRTVDGLGAQIAEAVPECVGGAASARR